MWAAFKGALKNIVLNTFRVNKLEQMTEQLRKVYVRSVPSDERLQMTLVYQHENTGRAKQYNFNRLKTEPLGTTLTRMQANINKYLAPKIKKNAKKNADAEPQIDIADVEVKLLSQTKTELDSGLENEKAWIQDTKLCIHDQMFNVEVNIPSVSSLTLPNSMMVGLDVYPKFQAEFTDPEKSSFKWYKQVLEEPEVDSVGEVGEGDSPHRRKKKKRTPVETWVELHQGPSYAPRNSDLNGKLKLAFQPCAADGLRFGKGAEVVSEVDVEAGPGICPFENRHVYTKKLAKKNCFRVACYNILADLYADSDFSREHLFPYCPPYALDIDYRKQLILKEIKGYNADIICLQECDTKIFRNDLLPALALDGFSGLHRVKGEDIPEGCATFYRKSKFSFVEEHSMYLTDIFNGEICKDLSEKLRDNEDYFERFQARHNTLQVCILESADAPGRKLCVAGTHFYFHPAAGNIRLLQTMICLRYLEWVKEKYGDDLVVIFCGDLNSKPDSAAYELITKKSIPSDHIGWQTMPTENNQTTADIRGIELSHDFDLYSACGTPEYTNYVQSFQGCLDYIFTEELLKVVQVVPLPSHGEVTLHTAIPSVVFPSDHVALVCDLEWNQ